MMFDGESIMMLFSLRPIQTLWQNHRLLPSRTRTCSLGNMWNSAEVALGLRKSTS